MSVQAKREAIVSALTTLRDADVVSLFQAIDMAYAAGWSAGVNAGIEQEKKAAQQRIGMQQAGLLQQINAGRGTT